MGPQTSQPMGLHSALPLGTRGRTAPADRVIPFDAVTPRNSSSPGPDHHNASQRLGDGTPRARGKTRAPSGTRNLKMKRVASPLQRKLGHIEQHTLVQDCRAEGAQDIEARMRTLESQRDGDHAHFIQIAQYIEGLEERHNTRLQELGQRYREIASNGMRF